jgi:hypothetical protein
MKKLVFMFVAVAAISFASCSNNQAQQAAPVDTDTMEVIDSMENVVDTLAADTLAAPVDSAAVAE